MEKLWKIVVVENEIMMKGPKCYLIGRWKNKCMCDNKNIQFVMSQIHLCYI